MKRILLPLIFLLALGTWAKSKEAERVSNAAEVLKEIMATPDKGIPRDYLERAHCLAIIPAMKKLALGFGGQYGRGVVACRKAGGAWGPPSMISLKGGSVGFQLGGESIDLVMLIMNRRGAEFLTSNKFNVGGDLSAAAGPVGRDATASTDIAMNAEIYTYSRARGLFGGVSLKGAVLKADDDGNKELYGRRVEARSLLLDGGVAPPADAQPLMNALAKYSAHK